MRDRESDDQISQRVRGVLISRLDMVLAKWLMPQACGERWDLDSDQWLELVRFIQETLFPEEFADRPPVSYRDSGLVPSGGRLARVSKMDYLRFAAKFK